MTKPVTALVALIDEDAWTDVADYPTGGQAQIAETRLGGRRLIVRRVRTLGAQGELFATWKHYPFATNRTQDIALVEAEHRDHAVIEQVIADLKAQALEHFPSGHFHANAAWTVLAALAHNLLRWTQLLGLPGSTVRVARTLRRRLLQVPGRLTMHARGWTLHLPARWPWQGGYLAALARIRALPVVGDRGRSHRRRTRPSPPAEARRAHQRHRLPARALLLAETAKRCGGQAGDPSDR